MTDFQEGVCYGAIVGAFVGAMIVIILSTPCLAEEHSAIYPGEMKLCASGHGGCVEVDEIVRAVKSAPRAPGVTEHLIHNHIVTAECERWHGVLGDVSYPPTSCEKWVVRVDTEK